MTCLRDFHYIVVLIYTKGLNCHSFAIVNAFPDIPEGPKGDRMFSRLDEFFGYDVGSGEQTRPTTELTKLLEYLHVMFWGRKGLCRTLIPITLHGITHTGHTLSNTSSNAFALFSSATRKEMYRLYNSRSQNAALKVPERFSGF